MRYAIVKKYENGKTSSSAILSSAASALSAADGGPFGRVEFQPVQFWAFEKPDFPESLFGVRVQNMKENELDSRYAAEDETASIVQFDSGLPTGTPAEFINFLYDVFGDQSSKFSFVAFRPDEDPKLKMRCAWKRGLSESDQQYSSWTDGAWMMVFPVDILEEMHNEAQMYSLLFSERSEFLSRLEKTLSGPGLPSDVYSDAKRSVLKLDGRNAKKALDAALEK